MEGGDAVTVASLWQQLHGTHAFLLAIEGLPRAVSSSFAPWVFGSPPADAPDPTDWTILRGVLATEDLRTRQDVALDACTLKASDLTFRLTDGEDENGLPFAVSGLLSREGAAVRTTLTATLTAGAVADMQVASSAAFPASGDWFCGLEAGDYASKADGTHLTTLTRGKYGSRARAHTYAAAGAVATVADYGQIPEVTDRPTSWYGRRCWLYQAEVLSDGSLDVAEIVWRGRITGELTAQGLEWVLPAESLPSALSTDLLGAQPSTVVQGIYLATSVDVEVEIVGSVTGETYGTTEFTVAADTYTLDALLSSVTTNLNAALDALAVTADRWELYEGGGRLLCHKVAADPADPIAHANLRIVFDLGSDLFAVQTLAAALNIVARELLWNRGGQRGFGDGQDLVLNDEWRRDGNEVVWDLGPAAMAVYVTGRPQYDGTFYLPVESKAPFTAYYDEDEAAGWKTASIVTVGGQPFILDSIHATDQVLIVKSITGHVEVSALIVQYVGDSPVEVRQGIWMRGELASMWRDAVLDHASVPEMMVVGADSRDFAWDDLDAQFPGGRVSQRDRLLTGPVSFLELLNEDFAYSGLCPILGLDGRITARPVNNTSLVRPDGALLLDIDADTISSKDRPELNRSPKRIVNRYTVRLTREVGRPGGLQPFDLEAIVNDKTSQSAHRMVRTVSREFSGALDTTVQNVAADVYGVAGTLFALLSRETDVLPVGPCNGIAYGVLPLDTVLVSHWLPPDPTSSGQRGLVSLPALVLAVEYDWTKLQVSLVLQLLVDNGQRSGFAPAARALAYVDHGVGTEPRRYEVSLTTGLYCPAAIEEGSFFKAGWKVALRQWGTDSITVATESKSLTDVDPDALFLNSAPTAGMQAEIAAGRCLIVPNSYDTAGQAALALLYLFVADDADNLLGTSGVLGFSVS